MQKQVTVLLCNVPLELGYTTPKELEARGLIVGCKYATQHTRPPFLINCSVYENERHIAEIGFKGGLRQYTKAEIEKMPISRVLLNVRSHGFIINGIDYAPLSIQGALTALGQGARHCHLRENYEEIVCRCGKYKTILTYETSDCPSCVTLTTHSLLPDWLAPWGFL